MECLGFWLHLKADLEQAERAECLGLQDRNGVMGKEINKLRSEINDLLDSEEILWHQRSRVMVWARGSQ